ncbi:MAG: GNAT family N-acetyltransferase [Anaerolineae bacterium]|nr:GNAT family N-acetyltransferase [Anaerolineae bacterium]
MNLHIRSATDQDTDAIVELSLLAWEPIFCSWRQVLGPQIYPLAYPDWRKSQGEGVEKAVSNTEKYHTLVAEVDGTVAGFLVYELKEQVATGEVQLLAVHPDYQNQGIGTQLNVTALHKMKAAGMRLAEVGTGGDEGHAPARRSYEKAGYTPLPLVRYYQDL